MVVLGRRIWEKGKGNGGGKEEKEESYLSLLRAHKTTLAPSLANTLAAPAPIPVPVYHH